MHCVRPWDYHSIGLTRIQFHPPNVTPLTNPAKVTDQGLCYCNSDAWGWHNSHQSWVISITNQLIFQNGKKLQSVQRYNNWPKTLPCGTPDTTLLQWLLYYIFKFEPFVASLCYSLFFVYVISMQRCSYYNIVYVKRV